MRGYSWIGIFYLLSMHCNIDVKIMGNIVIQFEHLLMEIVFLVIFIEIINSNEN